MTDDDERQAPAGGQTAPTPASPPERKPRRRMDKRDRRGRKARARAEEPLINVVRVPRVSDLGPMPTGTSLEMMGWSRKAMGIQLAQILADPEISESDRRKQANDTVRAMASLTPMADIDEASRLILGKNDDSDAGEGPQMESSSGAQQPIGAASGLPSAQRGRPPARGFGRS